MPTINKQELWQELDATDETFVRQKQARGGYGSTKGRAVRQWLDMKDAERKIQIEAENLRTSRATAIWTKISAIAAAIGVVITLIIALVPRPPI